MKILTFLKQAALIISGLMIAISGCAFYGPSFSYSFSFDSRHDNQDVQVLDFSLKARGLFIDFADKQMIKDGDVFPGQNVAVHGLPAPTSLYVKWRNRQTKKVEEATVSLEGRLPKDIEGMTLYFLIRDSGLQVFLSTNVFRKPSDPIIGSHAESFFANIAIFP